MLHKHNKHTKNPNRASSKMNKHKKHDISIKLSPHLSQCCKDLRRHTRGVSRIDARGHESLVLNVSPVSYFGE
jgi:malic enzyme